MSVPYMPLYVADYLADTSHLSAAEHGAYLMLIMHYWRQGGLPIEEAMLQRISRMTSREWAKSRDVLAAFFDDGWKHARIENELAKVAVKSNARSQSGKLGGDAKALKYKKPPVANATILPEQKPSKSLASSSEPDVIDSSLRSESNPSSLRSDSSKNGHNGHSVDLFGVGEKIERPKADRQAAIRIAGETWNELAAALRLPMIDSIKPGSKRERQALARTSDLQTDYGLGVVEGWKVVANMVRGSPYLRGEVNGFVCGFDWATKAENFTKIMEGNYEVRRQKIENFSVRG